MSVDIDKNVLDDYNVPQPNEISERDREDAMGAYLMMFAAVAVSLPLPIINLVAAIIYYYVNRTKSKFIHFHCLQSLISQIPTTLSNWFLLFWALQIWVFKNWKFDNYFFIYLGFVVLVNIVYIIFSLIAAIKARKGKLYYFIIFGTVSYNTVFNRNTDLEYDR